MADINPDDIPFVPSTDVSLIDTASGRPKTAFHDWMSSIFDWMKRSVVDLTTKITTLTFDVEGVQAEIVEEATIRQTEDGILAAQITTVAASVDDATANGQIYFAAKAAPGGSAAAYGLYLTAGSSYAGFEALALSAGGSAIGFTANQFRFTDNGSATAILTYAGGKWGFTSDVEIDGDLNIVNGSITVNGIAAGAVGFNGSHVRSDTVDLWPASGTGWNDYTAATLNPAKMGAGTFLFTFIGSARSFNSDGVCTMEFRIVRRKGGVDTPIYGPLPYTGPGTTAVYEHFRWFTDQAGAGTVQYVCQFRYVGDTGGSSGLPGIRAANYCRFDWNGFDT